MPLRRAFLLAAFLVASLAAPLAGAAEKEFVYVHDRADPGGEIFGFELKGSGALVPVPGSPVAATGSNAHADLDARTLAFADAKRVLIAACGADLYSFKVKADGSLTAAPGSPVATGMDQVGLALVERQDRTFVLTVDFVANSMRSFEVLSDGSLANTAGVVNFGAGDEPSSIAVSGKLAYVLKSGTGAVDKFEVGKAGEIGTSSFIELDVPSLVSSRAIAATPDGESLYLPADDEPWVGFVSRVGSDLHLQPAAKFPFDPVGAFALGGLALSDKVVVSFRAGDDGAFDVQSFKRQANNGLLLPLGGLESSGVPQLEAVALADGGTRLLAASGPSQTLVSFEYSTSTAAFTIADTEALASATNVTGLIAIRR